MDLTTVTALLGNIKTATELARAIKDSGTTLERAEMQLKLADLISSLADVKIEAAGVQQTLLDAQERVRKLEAAIKLRAELKWRQPCYWLPSEVKGVEEEPFCQACHDNEGKLSRLHSDGKGHFQCRVCKQSFNTSERSARDKAEFDAAMRNSAARGRI